MLFAQQRPLIPSVGHRFGYIHEYPTDYLPLSSLPGWWFQPTPLKNMTSSVGMMNFPYIMESHESYVPNHQPDKIASHM